MNNKSTLTKSLFDPNLPKSDIDYRLQLLQYLDTSYYEKGEFLFFNMLEYTRFIRDNESIAYTTPDKMIYLNAPTQKLGNENWKWNFVFAHECMHQIYDTFGVAAQIKSELGKDKYDHYLLNIASDCVINQTLFKLYKKKMPDNLITAKYLKQQYGVDYDMYTDTQFSLYLKLLEIKQKQQELFKKMLEDAVLNEQTSIHDIADGQSPQPSQQGPTGQGQPSQGQGEGKSGQQGEGQGSKPGEGQEGEGQQGQQQGQGEGGDKNQTNQNSTNKSTNVSNEQFGEYKDLLDYYDSEPEHSLDDIINKAKNTLTGPLGQFIENLRKIPGEIKKTKYGISISADKGNKTDYVKDLFNKTRIILSNKVRSLQKKYKATYARANRRNPYSDGGIIKKGRKIEQDKLDLDLSFFVDISGSMGDTVVASIFNNLYSNGKSITETYTKTYKDVLNNVIFNYYAFNENISPVKNHRIPRSNGGNVPLDQLVKYMKLHTETSLINVIITDAGFDIDNNKLIAELGQFTGFLIIITNDISRWSGYSTIEKQSNGQIIAIHTNEF